MATQKPRVQLLPRGFFDSGPWLRCVQRVRETLVSISPNTVMPLPELLELLEDEELGMVPPQALKPRHSTVAVVKSKRRSMECS